MIKSYFRIALRNFSKNKLTTFINVFGLGLSMSVGLMIMIRIQDQFSYDTFHPAPERTYRITSEFQKKNEPKWKMASTPLPLAEALLKNNTAIETAVNIYPALNGKATAAGKELYISGAFTEPSFFKVFGFTVAAGNPVTALQQPNSIVINKTIAGNYFGSTAAAIGKIMQMENGVSYIVTGVLNDPPAKSHIQFDAFAAYSTLAQLEKKNILPLKSNDQFAFNAGYTYLLVKKGADKAAVQSQLNAIAGEMNRQNEVGTAAFHLQSLSAITPGTDELTNNMGGGTSWTKIFIEGGMALLILLAACFNYTNLTIARALTRAKEVGVRKIAGAKRSQVFVQYIFESVLLSLLALCFAWFILSLIVRYAPFNDGYEFIPSSFRYNNSYIAASVLYAVFTGLLAGTSPAWILSAFKPLQVLKNLSTAKTFGKLGLQKTLIVFQYSLSLVIIIFLSVFYRQFSFMADIDPGFKKDHVLVIPSKGIDEKIAKQKILTVSGVKTTGSANADFSKRFTGMNAPLWISNKQDAVNVNYYYADADFISMMGFGFITGSNFPPVENKEAYILINEKAAQALGFKDASKAISQKIWINDSTQLEIAAVLNNFHYENAGRPIQPLAFRNKANAGSLLYVHTDGGDKQVMEQRIKAALSDLSISKEWEAGWLDEEMAKSNSQAATISLLGYLGFIAAAIATLGLLGLVIYTIQVRAKEISIRKIIGATEKQLVQILSRGFVKLLIIAGCIAMPIGWLLAIMFLQNFSSRVNFGVLDVGICFLFLLGIGLFTVISQTYKASIANPAKRLRTE